MLLIYQFLFAGVSSGNFKGISSSYEVDTSGTFLYALALGEADGFSYDVDGVVFNGFTSSNDVAGVTCSDNVNPMTYQLLESLSLDYALSGDSDINPVVTGHIKNSDGNPFVLNFDVETGKTYKIQIILGENWNNPNRSMNIAVEGQVVASDIRVVNVATFSESIGLFTHVVTSEDNTLTIEVSKGSSFPILVSAVSIEQLDLLSGPVYVDGNAGEIQNGTFDFPFKSIGQAADVAGPGAVIYIRAGRYNETLRPTYSGLENNPIVFTSYNNEDVIISAGEKVTGWIQHSVNKYSVNSDGGELDDDNDLGLYSLYCDSGLGLEMMVESRYPNISGETELLTPGFVTCDISSSSVQSSSFVGKNFTGGFFIARSGANWAMQTAEITSHNASTGTIYLGNKTGYDSGFWWWNRSDAKGFVVGLFEPDITKEWSYNSSTDEIVFYPPNGQNPDIANYDVYFKKRHLVVDLGGFRNIKISNIGMQFGSINMDDSENCEIENCNIEYPSHYWFLENARSGFIEPNPGYSPDPRTGIYMSGKNNKFLNNQVSFSAGHGLKLDGRDNNVSGNYILNTNYMGSYASPIFIDYHDGPLGENVGKHLIQNNTIKNCGRSGININSSPLGSADKVEYSPMKILFNEVINVGYLTKDLGGIYSWQVDGGSIENGYTHIAYNFLDECFAGDASWGGSGYGLYSDAGTQYMSYHHNIVQGYDQGSHVNSDAIDIFVSNNTLWNLEDYAAVFQYYSGTTTMINNHLKNNLSSHNAWRVDSGFSMSFVSNNYTLNSSQVAFVKAEGSRYYKLSSTSNAIDSGVTYSPFTDFSADITDIGAYEYGGSDMVSNWVAGKGNGITFQAENFDKTGGYNSGLYEVDFLSRGLAMGGAENGDWICFEQVFFDDYNAIEISYAVAQAYAGQKVEIRLNSPTGKKIGELITSASATDSWFDTDYKVTAISDLGNSINGVYDLYIVFKGIEGIGNFDWFRLFKADFVNRLEAESAHPFNQYGTSLTADGTAVGSCDDNDWLRFEDVDLNVGYTNVNMYLSVPGSNAGQIVDIRLDSPSGLLIGQLTTESTGSWTNFEKQTASIIQSSGVHDVYFVFNGGSGIGNFDAFEFYIESNNYCDCDNNGNVDLQDLQVIVDNWLDNDPESRADLFPIGGDGVVNFLDYEVFFNCWN